MVNTNSVLSSILFSQIIDWNINYAIDKIIAQDGKAEKHDTVWLNREVQRK